MNRLELEILTLLNERGELSGYQIDRALLRKGIPEFPLNALFELMNRGLVEGEAGYRISAAGREALSKDAA